MILMRSKICLKNLIMVNQRWMQMFKPSRRITKKAQDLAAAAEAKVRENTETIPLLLVIYNLLVMGTKAIGKTPCCSCKDNNEHSTLAFQIMAVWLTWTCVGLPMACAHMRSVRQHHVTLRKTT